LSCDICVDGREVRSFSFELTWFFEDTTYNFDIIIILVRARVAQWVRYLDYQATRTNRSPIRRGFAPVL
jgi:hypothetical protein